MVTGIKRVFFRASKAGKKSKKSQHDRKDQNALRKNRAFQELKRDMEQRARNRAKLVTKTL